MYVLLEMNEWESDDERGTGSGAQAPLPSNLCDTVARV